MAKTKSHLVPFAELHKLLKLSTDDFLPLGTLRLESQVLSGSADAVGSGSSKLCNEHGEPEWRGWTPGCFTDVPSTAPWSAGIWKPAKTKGHKTQTPGAARHGRKSSTDGNSLKRRRSASSVASLTPSTSTSSVLSSGTSATTVDATAPAFTSPAKGKYRQSEILQPTCKDIDYIVAHAFAFAEYLITDTLPPNIGDCNGPSYKILLRLYAIPLDAPGLNARLDRVGMREQLRSNARRRAAEAVFKRILYHLVYDTTEWSVGHEPWHVEYVLHRDKYPKSLLEVYNELEDPAPTVLPPLTDSVLAMLRDILEQDAPEGMTSRLYEFQKHCLWKLASRELAPQRKLDLTYTPLLSLERQQRRYFIDSNHSIWYGVPSYVEPKSAIVSEGMGTGKTCICLALVLVTQHQLAVVDTSSVLVMGRGGSDISSVRTFKHENFPWTYNGDANGDASSDASGDDEQATDAFKIRKRLKLDTYPSPMDQMPGRADAISIPAPAKREVLMPSLRDMALDILASSKHHRQLTHDLEAMGAHIQLSDGDLPYFWEIPNTKRRGDTRSTTKERRKIYVSAATLVIVPDLLVAQWVAEMHKHINVPDALEYVKVEKGDRLPSEQLLAKVDVVLMSESRVRGEAAKDRDWEPAATICRCSYIGSTRQVNCRCKTPANMGNSPLTGVFWKRLIVDEGHKVAGRSELVKMCMRLRTEARYLVSGTPSKNLVGLNDVNAEEQWTDSPHLSLHDASSAAAADRVDFERLANISNFLGLEPFSNADSSPFMRAFYDIYLERGDTTGIKNFLAQTMVRHQVPDVDLPPLTRSVIELSFNTLERTTYNVLLALFASNAVQSERKDEDYFFHPSQKGSLNALISNLGAAHLLYSSPELLKGIVSTIASNEKAIKANAEKPPGQRWGSADLNLIQEAQAHLKHALNDTLWRFAQTGSMVYGAERFPSDLVTAFGGITLGETSGSFMPGEKVASLRFHIGKQLRTLMDQTKNDVDAHGNGAALTSGEDFIEDLITSAHKEAQKQRENSLVPRVKPSKRSPAKRPVKGNVETPSARRAATDAFKRGSKDEQWKFSATDFPIDCDLPLATLVSIASTKVAYILQSVLAHPEDKVLVFSGGSSSNQLVSGNNLYYIAEALDFANVPHLILARTLSQEKLAAYVKAFNDSAVFRVLLLDIKFAGRGLTLSSANRVIFIEPVWHKDEEAQAVKRAHRLGQSRPVHVETLVMKDSFEEKVMRRGAELTRRETSDARTPYEDGKLSATLRGMTFLSTLEERSDTSVLTELIPALQPVQNRTAGAEDELYNAVLWQQAQQKEQEAGACSEPDRSMSPSSSRSASLVSSQSQINRPTRPSKSSLQSRLYHSSRLPGDESSDDSDSMYVASRPAAPPAVSRGLQRTDNSHVSQSTRTRRTSPVKTTLLSVDDPAFISESASSDDSDDVPLLRSILESRATRVLDSNKRNTAPESDDVPLMQQLLQNSHNLRLRSKTPTVQMHGPPETSSIPRVRSTLACPSQTSKARGLAHSASPNTRDLAAKPTPRQPYYKSKSPMSTGRSKAGLAHHFLTGNPAPIIPVRDSSYTPYRTVVYHLSDDDDVPPMVASASPSVNRRPAQEAPSSGSESDTPIMTVRSGPMSVAASASSSRPSPAPSSITPTPFRTSTPTPFPNAARVSASVNKSPVRVSSSLSRPGLALAKCK